MRALILLLTLPLAGCISLTPKPPPSLLTLPSSAAMPVGTTRSAATAPTITISRLSVPSEIAVTRVPVQTSGSSIAYVKDAQWVSPPAQLFSALLADHLTAQTSYLVVTPRQALAAPGVVLGGEIRAFGIDSDHDEAVVTYDATLVRKGGAIEAQRFEAREPISSIDSSTVGPALGRAANRVADKVADWVAGSANN